MLSDSVFASESLFVVGNVNRDIKTAPLRPGNALFEDGERHVAWIEETIGGGGAHAAAAAAALGAKAALAGKIGADGLGRRLVAALERPNIELRLRKDPSVSTGTSINLSYESCRRHFLSCLPNNEALDFEDLDLAGLGSFEHLYRADVWFSEAMLYGGNRRLFEAARQAGVAVSLDLNWDPLWETADDEEIIRRKQAVRELLPLVRMAHGSIRELNRFAGCRNLARALRSLEKSGVESVLVHMGSEGTGYYSRGALTVERPVPVRKYVNTTGTGDVLSVCMMLLDGRTDVPIKDKLRLGNTIVAEYIEGRRRFIPKLDDGSSS